MKQYLFIVLLVVWLKPVKAVFSPQKRPKEQELHLHRLLE
jgi:hypothetical protein